MAARTSASTGTLVLTSILGITTLGLFITSVVFFAQRRAAIQDKERVEAIQVEYVNERDRNDPVILRLKEEARKQRPPQTLAGFMLNERTQLMTLFTGSKSDTYDTVSKALELQGVTTSALAALKDRAAQIEALNKRVAAAELARDRALQDKESESKRVAAIEAASRDTVAKLTDDVGQTKQETDQLRTDVGTAKSEMDSRVQRIESEFASKETDLRGEIEKLQSERAVNLQQIKHLEDQIRGRRFAGEAEYALVDGQVVGINSAENTAIISIGKNNKVVLGMTFEVYTQGATIQPDAKTGEYPRGKASIEVIRVDADSAVGRILREQKGSPIVRGDLIANALYDPNKSYKFLVFGNFDPSRTGVETPQGANQVRAWIKDWGGSVTDELVGDVDFIVLGARPPIPPEPSASQPIEVVQEFIRQQRIAKRYDELLQQAVAANIPVLNQNRLMTLIGK